MSQEQHQMSENMKVFFEKLLALKAYAKEQSYETHQAGAVWDFVHEQLDAIIKEKQ